MVPTRETIKNRVADFNLKRARLTITTALLGVMLTAGNAAAQNSGGGSGGGGADPSSAVSGAIDSLVSEAAEIGSLLLFAYGFYQLINAGMSDQKSGPLKKVAVSWGLGIIVRSWDTFMNFITSNNVASSSTIEGAAATTKNAVVTVDPATYITPAADIALSVV